ncbi:sulfotransferase domain-containing protein [Rubellimicrobium rubrum]|uniref:Sulfotransferase domain-containing protein n=1 Tax=Rubellimicrobium rubrum TaxID=2585369 RepID=A0A5C4MKL9_9RHOB|nr:sulfotransferase [Rubellimicrobium rubrum]TNC44207.1 sulfotransferase domain-containing protein [Rubellimicrobium rubrum]
MPVPTFLCVGAQEAGTSWFRSMLEQHPSVYLPPLKEIHFFDYIHLPHHRNWVASNFAASLKHLRRQGGDVDYLDRLERLPRETDEWYAAVFGDPRAHGRLCGEITPAYSILSQVGIEHVHRLNPDIRIIFIIRDPVDRALAQLKANAAQAGLDRVPEDILERGPTMRGVIARSAYHANIEHWEKVVPPEQILYLPYRMIALDPGRFMAEVEHFLGLRGHEYVGLGKAPHDRAIAIDPEVSKALELDLEGERIYLSGRFSNAFSEGRAVVAGRSKGTLAKAAKPGRTVSQVVIHAGIHRTGTTSLQQFLSGNRTALAAEGVSYPGGRVHHQHLAWGLRRGEISTSDMLDHIAMQEGKASTVVLSAEDFCILTDLAWVETIAKTYPTRVVFYLRRQDHWLMSWYNQHVKWPFETRKAQMAPDEFLASIEDFYWLDFSTLLGRWEAAIGAENVSIGVLEKGQVGDVVNDFVDRVGLCRDGLSFGEKRINDSLPVHVLEIARHLGLAGMAPSERMRLLGAIRAAFADKPAPASTVYSPEERQSVLDRFARSNHQVARRYFARDELFLEPPPAPDAPYFHFPDMARQELIREWVAPVIRQLVSPDGRK